MLSGPSGWRTLLAFGTALSGVGIGLSTAAAAPSGTGATAPPGDKSASPAQVKLSEHNNTPDAARLHAARELLKKQREQGLGQQDADNDDGIVLTKLLKPTTNKPLVVLVSCGSYSPITNMHLLVFEQARNYLQLETGKFEIIGGFLSPVHDAYGKATLIPQQHRLSMCEAAVQSSKWLSVQQWEIKQLGWTTTAETLCKYQEALNRAHLTDQPIRVKFLCGADVIESTLIPNLWSPADLDLIFGTIGVAVIERVGLDLPALIASSPVLSKYADNIDLVPQRISNTISSTTVRKLIQAQQSVRFLTPDAVIEYIQANKLYGHDPAKHVPAEYLEPKL